MIERGRFPGGYTLKVSSPGHVNGMGRPDDFACYCSTLDEACAIQAARDHVAAKPSPRRPSGKWNGPPTPWLTSLAVDVALAAGKPSDQNTKGDAS